MGVLNNLDGYNLLGQIVAVEASVDTPSGGNDLPISRQGPDHPPFRGSLARTFPSWASSGRPFCWPDRRYSAALATRPFSASSKASMRRDVAMGDFVYRARRL